MEVFIPVFLIILLIIFGIWLICKLISLYKQYSVYKYLKATINKDKMSKSPCSFHASVIYMMGRMLRANFGQLDIPKIEFMIRYLNEACPAECRDEVIDVLDLVTKRCLRNEITIGGKSLINKENLKRNNGQSYFNNDNWGLQTNPVYGKEMATELSKYLNEKDRLYLLYLLFCMATIDGHYTENRKDGGISDHTILEDDFVKGLNLPEESLTQMVQAWREGRMYKWYHTQFDGGDYPGPSKLADLYPHIAFYTLQQNKEVKGPKIESKYLTKIEIVLSIAQPFCWFAFILFFHVSNAILDIGIFIFLFLRIAIYAHPRYTYSEILVVPSEIRFSLLSLLGNVFHYMFIFTFWWLMLVNILYYMVDTTYERNLEEIDLPIISTDVTKGGKYTSHYLVFDKNIEDYIVPQPKPVLPAFSQVVADAIPLLPGANLYDFQYNEYESNELYVEFDKYEKAKDGHCNANLKLSIGYYGKIIGHSCTVYKNDN